MELFIIMIALIIGIIWGLYFKISIVFFFPVLFIVYFILNKKFKIKSLKKYIIIFLIVISISNLNILKLENKFEQKYKNVINCESEIIGTIISNPIEKEYNIQYILEVEQVNKDISYKNTKILLKIKKEKIKFKYGDKIKLIAEIEEPSSQRNKGGFDYKQYLKTKKIYVIASTKESNIYLIKENNVNIINKFVNVISNKIKEKTNKILDKDKASIITAILIGNKDNLSDEIEEDFRNSSLSHILAVSGMHVSYIIMIIAFVINKGKINKKISKIFIILFLLFFMLLTGKTPSVERASLMSIYMILGSMLYKKTNTLASISISMIIILIENTYSILDIGLQLSYSGTIGIVLIYPILKNFKTNKIKKLKIIDKAVDILLVTISANIILFPIVLFHFNTVSTVFLFSNLLVSPIIGIIIFLGFFTIIISYIFPFFTFIFSSILQFVLNILLKTAHIIGNLPFSKIILPTPKIYKIVIYYIIILIILKYKKILKVNKIIFKRIISIVLIITVLGNILLSKLPGSLKIYFIDVGQGDSTLIITPNNKSILIDGGGSRDNKSYDIGKNTLLPYLLDRGITKIDYMIISHFDLDHVGGLLTIMEELKVKKVVICKQGEDSENYKIFKEIVKEKKIKVIVVKIRR